MPTGYNRIEVKRRSSATLNNALRFKPAYDQAIINMKDGNLKNKDVLVSFESQPSLNQLTFKQRITEGLRYIIDHWDDIPPGFRSKDLGDYIMLRGIVKFQFIPNEGINICFPGSALSGMTFNTASTSKDDLSRAKWKGKLLRFLDNPEANIFKEEGLMLDEDDVEWVKNLFVGLPYEMRVDRMKIYVVK
jgi:hypothetical protein